MSTSNTEESTMISNNCSTKFRNIVVEVDQIFRLFVGLNIVEMNIFITPFKVMNYSLISQFFLNYENILEKINYSFFDVKVIEFCYHSFLIFQIGLILVY